MLVQRQPSSTEFDERPPFEDPAQGSDSEVSGAARSDSDKSDSDSSSEDSEFVPRDVAGTLIWNTFQDLFRVNCATEKQKAAAFAENKDEISIVSAWARSGETWSTQATAPSKQNHTIAILRALTGGKMELSGAGAPGAPPGQHAQYLNALVGGARAFDELGLHGGDEDEDASGFFCPPVPDDALAMQEVLELERLSASAAGTTSSTRKKNWTSRLNLNEDRGLLLHPTFRQMEHNALQDDVIDLVGASSFRKIQATRDFENKQIGHTEYCEFRTRQQCIAARGEELGRACDKIHFKRVIKPWTDFALGDCSYLNTCRKMHTCKYVHYTLDLTYTQAARILEKLGDNFGTTGGGGSAGAGGALGNAAGGSGKVSAANHGAGEPGDLLRTDAQDARKINELQIQQALPSQWINCDVRNFDFSLLHNQV
eukprot:g10381.t1